MTVWNGYATNLDRLFMSEASRFTEYEIPAVFRPDRPDPPRLLGVSVGTAGLRADHRLEDGMSIVVRTPETTDELLGKAYVWWQAWNEAYPGIVSEERLASRSLPEYERRSLSETEGVIVAKDGERVAGFAKLGPCGDDDLPGAGEVHQLYILAEWYGQGVGWQLMREAERRLEEEGADGIVVWVLERNGRAIRFYERYGFVADGHRQEMPRLGDGVTAMRMVLRRDGNPTSCNRA